MQVIGCVISANGWMSPNLQWHPPRTQNVVVQEMPPRYRLEIKVTGDTQPAAATMIEVWVGFSTVYLYPLGRKNRLVCL